MAWLTDGLVGDYWVAFLSPSTKATFKTPDVVDKKFVSRLYLEGVLLMTTFHYW